MQRLSLECQEWLLVSAVLWGGGCQPMARWDLPCLLLMLGNTNIHCFFSTLPWARARLSSQGLVLISVLAFLRKVGAEMAWPQVTSLAPLPQAHVAPRGRGKLSLSAPSCLGHTARRCRRSSGGAAKPAVTGHWVPTNINVMFTAYAEVPHGLQAVSSWPRARREITQAAW